MKKSRAIMLSSVMILALGWMNRLPGSGSAAGSGLGSAAGSGLGSAADSAASSGYSEGDQSKNDKKDAKEKKKVEEAKIRAARALCSAVDTLIGAGRNGYEFVKGSRNYEKSGDKWIAYDASTILPGANDCTVFVDRYTGRDSYVACTGIRTIESVDREAAVTAWQQEVIAAIQPCLPKDWTKIDDRKQHPAGYFLMGEGDPGPKLEIDIARGKSDKVVELRVNFYPK